MLSEVGLSEGQSHAVEASLPACLRPSSSTSVSPNAVADENRGAKDALNPICGPDAHFVKIRNTRALLHRGPPLQKKQRWGILS